MSNLKVPKTESNKPVGVVSGNLKLQVISGWLQVGAMRITEQQNEIKQKYEDKTWKRSKN